MRPSLALLAVLAVTPVGAQDEGGTEAPAPALRFAWPLPSQAVVTQTTTKKGHTVTVRYPVRLEAAGDELALRFGEVQPLRLDGLDLTTPEGQAMLGPRLAGLAQPMPDLRIGRDGALLGVVDYEGFVERSIAAVRAVQRDANEAALEQTRRFMLDPQNRQMLSMKAGELWQMWVSTWEGLELAPGDVLEGQTEIPIGPELVDADLRVEHLGERPHGEVGLRITTVLESPEATAALVKVMKSMAAGGPRPLDDMPPVDEFRQVTRVEVVTDPATLRPRRAESELTKAVAIRGEQRREEVERRVYELSWAPAPVHRSGGR